jgi:hypothetical protein
MRLLIVWLGGFVLGALAAAVTLYFDPLAAQSDVASEAVGEGTQNLHYAVGGSDAFALTHAAPPGLKTHPASVPTLFEAALAKTALGVFLLTDDVGVGVAVATRISKLSNQTNPLTKGIVLADDWIVSVPGSGTYVVEQQSNVWPLLRDTVVDVGLLKRAWSDHREFPVTIGPGIGGQALVTGASGIYRDVGGTAVERMSLDGFMALGQLPDALAGTLTVTLQAPSAAEATEPTLSAAEDSP